MLHGMGEAIVNYGAEMDVAEPSHGIPSYLLPPAPQATTLSQHRDFLMLTEFTEDLGPVPLV